MMKDDKYILWKYRKLLITIWVVVTLIFSATVTIDYLSNSPQASMDPKGGIFETQNRIDEEFPNPVHVIPFEILGIDDEDVLTKDVLLEFYTQSELLRKSEIGKEYLTDFIIPSSGNTGSLGLLSIADVLNNFFLMQGSSLLNATDSDVKDALNILFSDPTYGAFLKSQLSDEAIFEDNEWKSPAFFTFITTNNEKLGGGVFRRTVGGDYNILKKEKLNRNIEKILQGEEYNLLGIGIDLNIEAKEEGYSLSVIGLMGVLLITLSMFIGIIFSSFRVTLISLLGLATLFIWIRGFPFATMGLIKPSLTTEVILPIAFMAFGIDYFIHVIHQYKEELLNDMRGSSISIIKALKHLRKAIFLAMITSAIAFGANYISDVEAVKAFAITGIFAAFSAYFIMGIVTPIAFVMINEKNSSKFRKSRQVINVGAFMSKVIKYKKIVITFLLLITALFTFQAIGVEKKLDPKDFISSESNFVVSLNKRDRHFSDTRGEEASIYIRADFNNNKVKKAFGEVMINLQNNEHLAHTREGILVLPYGLSETKKIDENTFAKNIIFEVTGTRRQENIKKAYLSLEENLLPISDLAEYEIVGSPFTRDASLEAVTSSLVNTFSIAIIIIFIILLITFRSFVYTIITLIPMILVVIWTYGLMNILGFSLNFITATIAAVSLGVGIDYSVHVVQRFRQEFKEGKEFKDVLKEVGYTTGFAILISAISSIIGFLFLASAPMPLFTTYGILTAFMTVFSLLVSIVLIPILISFIKKS